MKINELMIGDWVTIAECKTTQMAIGCAKIVGIDRKISIEPYTVGFEYSFYDDKGKECIALNSCSIDRLRPIPLTTEILEKNGFEVQEQGDGKKDVWTGFGIDCEGDIEVEFQYNTPAHLKIDGVFKGEYYVSRNIKYVHELQHALRLCGTEKEIEL